MKAKLHLLIVLFLSSCAGAQLVETECPVQVLLKVPKPWKVDNARIRIALAERGYRVVEKGDASSLLLKITGESRNSGGSVDFNWSDPSAKRSWIPQSVSTSFPSCASEGCGVYEILTETPVCEN